MSIGFCRENLDLNKNAIIENKKKEYWVLDLFDGETYSHKDQNYNKYIPDQHLLREGDVIGSMIDLDSGIISFFKNGQDYGAAFTEGSFFRNGKLYPFVQLYKCKVQVFQPNELVQVNMDIPANKVYAQ